MEDLSSFLRAQEPLGRLPLNCARTYDCKYTELAQIFRAVWLTQLKNTPWARGDSHAELRRRRNLILLPLHCADLLYYGDLKLSLAVCFLDGSQGFSLTTCSHLNSPSFGHERTSPFNVKNDPNPAFLVWRACCSVLSYLSNEADSSQMIFQSSPRRSLIHAGSHPNN